MPRTPPPPHPQRWLKVRSEPLATTRIFDVTREFFRHPQRKREQDFFVINAPDWVNVMALTADRRLVLVKQFRFGTDDFSVEIPGGIIDAGENAIAAGRRELREETGYVGRPARLLGAVHPNPAMQNNRCHLVLIENAHRAADTDWDPDEEMEILSVPVDEVYAMAHRGDITHAMVLDALLLFMPYWTKLNRRPI